jgi:heme-degrading monooxygenase HmoA
MFARLTIVQVATDKIDEVIRIFDESIAPAAKAQKGSGGIYLLTDRQTGKGIALSFWDSEADAVANEGSGYYQEQVGKVAAFFTTAPVREGYEVSVQV